MSHIFSVSSPRKQRGSVGVNSRPSDLKRRRHFLHLPLLPPHSTRLFNTAARVTFIYIREKCSMKDSRVELLLFVSERLHTGSPNTRKPPFYLETHGESICTQGEERGSSNLGASKNLHGSNNAKEKYRPHLHVKPEWRHRRRRRDRKCPTLVCAPADSGTWCGPAERMKRENYAGEHLAELLVFTCCAKLPHDNATTVKGRRWPTTQRTLRGHWPKSWK